MFEELKEYLKNSYSPYSNFKVSSCLVTKNNKKYFGVNVENASYGATICAERVAITNAIARGYKKGDFKELHVMSNSNKLGVPCFLCRQVMSEFFDKKTKIIVYSKSHTKSFKMAELCPLPFNEDSLWKVEW